MKRFILALIINFIILSNVASAGQNFHDSTDWVVTPSLKYDMMCFLNLMTGDSFYVPYYKEEYEKFKDRITPSAEASLKNLKRVIKDEGGDIVSAWLALYLSATDAETPAEILTALDDLPAIKERFDKSPYADEEAWHRFEQVTPDLKTAVRFLMDIKFPEYWEENLKPALLQNAAKTHAELQKYNVVKEVERYLGFSLEDNRITVYVLYYPKPHGVKITGMRFLTFGDYPFKVTLNTSVHEMMHPPYDLKNDTELASKIDLFRQDDFVMDKVNNHDPAFGYNSFEGVMEEDCVKAIDQVINTKFGCALEPRFRWKDNDGGMHVFAAALYHLMEKENFANSGETFREFFIRTSNEGKLVPGKVKELYDDFYKDYSPPKQ